MNSLPFGRVLLAAALALAGCSESGRFSDAAARDLQGRTATIRQAVASLDAAGAAVRLEDLRRAVEGWMEAGELDRARAEEILDAAEAVERGLSLLGAPAQEASPVEEPTEEETAEAEQDEDVDEDSSGPGSGEEDSSGPGSGEEDVSGSGNSGPG